jgi:hypothetical protein
VRTMLASKRGARAYALLASVAEHNAAPKIQYRMTALPSLLCFGETMLM